MNAAKTTTAEDGPGLVASVAERPVARTAAWAVAAAFAYYFVLQWFWPAPIGVLFQGLIVGGLTALIAFGLALIYRANRIINFAAGDLGGAPAALAVALLLGPGISYFFALPIALAAAVVLGAFVEFVFIRRFFKAPRLILTVVTIGVSQILAFATVILPRAFDLNRPSESFPSPLDLSFNIGRVVIQGNEIIALFAVPLVILALTAFLRYTNVGIAVRASAESADRAALLGVPVKRIQTIVWVVATLLATVAMFLRAGVMGLPIGSVLGPTVLIKALTAGVIGRMERLPTILVASLALGMLETSILYRTGRGFLVDPILFLVVLAALLFQRRRQSRVQEDQVTSWQAAREVRPIPRELAHLPEVRWGLRGLTWGFAALLVALPLVMNDGQINLAGVIVVLAMVCVSLVILTGWSGQVSLGQVAFMGIGAAVGGYVTSEIGWDLSLALVVAGLAGAVAAMVIGLPALRIQGLFLAVVTLAFALAVSSWGLNSEFVHWLPEGRLDRPRLFGQIAVNTEVRYYYFTLACLLIAIFIAKGIRRSRTGRVLIGIRENQRQAQSYGVNATSAKLTAFAVSGFIAAFAGAVFVHHQQSLGITPYSVNESRAVFIMVVIGGLGSIPGALIGATFIQGIEYFNTSFPDAVRPYLQFIASGVGVIFVLLLLPGGLSQLLYDLRDRGLRMIADRRGILVPSLVADMRATLPEETARPATAVDDTELAVDRAFAAASRDLPAALADGDATDNGGRPTRRDPARSRR